MRKDGIGNGFSRGAGQFCSGKMEQGRKRTAEKQDITGDPDDGILRYSRRQLTMSAYNKAGKTLPDKIQDCKSDITE